MSWLVAAMFCLAGLFIPLPVLFWVACTPIASSSASPSDPPAPTPPSIPTLRPQAPSPGSRRSAALGVGGTVRGGRRVGSPGRGEALAQSPEGRFGLPGSPRTRPLTPRPPPGRGSGAGTRALSLQGGCPVGPLQTALGALPSAQSPDALCRAWWALRAPVTQPQGVCTGRGSNDPPCPLLGVNTEPLPCTHPTPEATVPSLPARRTHAPPPGFSVPKCASCFPPPRPGCCRSTGHPLGAHRAAPSPLSFLPAPGRPQHTGAGGPGSQRAGGWRCGSDMGSLPRGWDSGWAWLTSERRCPQSRPPLSPRGAE